MSILTSKKSIASIVAPINKIVADLRTLAEKEQTAILDKTEQVDTLNAEIETATKEAATATELAEKYAKLVA